MYDEPWYIDAPAAERNLSRRVRTATSIQVNDPIDITIEDPDLFEPSLDLHRRSRATCG